jgi:YggT family protein
MGETYASLTLLTDAIGSIERFVSVFVWVYILLIFAYVLSSWIRVPYSVQPLVRFLHDVCEPYLRLFRRILPPLGPVDVSPIVAVFALYIALWLVNNVLLDNLR